METLYFGGPILTMEGEGLAQALLERDGVIRAVGPREELHTLSPGARQIDLAGNTLLPAFLDPHSHLCGTAFRQLQVPLEGARSDQDIEARLNGFLRTRRVPPGQWITATGYDHNDLAGGRHPTRALLDRAAPRNPVVLQHRSGHMGVLNSAALERLGITADTPDPSGGRIGREHGALTGYLEENAFLQAQKQIPMPGPGELADAFVQAQREYAAHGIATAQEGYLTQELIPYYRYALDHDLLTLDVTAYPGLDTLDAARAALPAEAQAGLGRFRLGGVKLFLDGSPQGRTAWMRTPYLDGPADYRGYGTMSDQALRDALETAYVRKLQPLAHCNGDAAAGQYLAAIDTLEGAHPDFRELRPVMIHAQLLDLDQIGTTARLGVIPSFFVAHVYHWGDVHVKNFGPERAGRISPAKAAGDAGIPFTFHQDSPVIPPDMLETVWAAVNRRTKGGALLGPGQRIGPEEALRAVTIHAARQYFEEERKGSLRPGKAADLAILDANPLTVPPEALREIRVLTTLKGGKAIYRP